MSRFHTKVNTVTLEDGAGVTLELRPTSGDFQCSNWALDGNAETQEARHRGTHDGLFEGDDVTQEWSITLFVPSQSHTHATSARIYDWVVNHRKGTTALTNVETSGSGRWAFKVNLDSSDGTNTGGFQLPKSTVMIANYNEGTEGDTITLTGTNFVAPTVS